MHAQSTASTASSSPRTLEQYIDAARKAPSTVQHARLLQRSAQANVNAARANFLPILTVNNTFAYNSPLLYAPGQFSYVALNGVHEYSTLGNAALELDASGRLRALLDRARANRDIATANVEISDRDLVRLVTTAYFHVVLARHLLASANENLQAARDFEERVKKLEAAGEVAHADTIKASLEVALMEKTAQSSALEAELASHELASYYTTDTATAVNVADELDVSVPPPPMPLTGASPYLKRPELRSLAAEAFGFHADARQMRAKLLPQVTLQAQYGIDSTRYSFRDRGYALFGHLDIPVFDWFRSYNEMRAYTFQARQAENDIAVARRTYSKEYQDALSSVASSYQQTQTAERELQLAKENVRLSMLRYTGGEGSATEVVTSQQQLTQAQIDWYSARANYSNAQSALKVASGQ